MKKFLLAFALLFLSLQIFAQGVFEKKSFTVTYISSNNILYFTNSDGIVEYDLAQSSSSVHQYPKFTIHFI